MYWMTTDHWLQISEYFAYIREQNKPILPTSHFFLNASLTSIAEPYNNENMIMQNDTYTKVNNLWIQVIDSALNK